MSSRTSTQDRPSRARSHVAARALVAAACFGAVAAAFVACSDDDAGPKKGGEGGGGGAGGGASGPASWNREVTPPSDEQAAAQRAACAYRPGALPAETQGASHPNGDEIPIDHVLILMQENRSFDHYFQMLPESGQPDVEVAPPGYTNPDAEGNDVAPFHDTSFCFVDTNHEWSGSHEQYDDGMMDGFLRSNEEHGSAPPHPPPDGVATSGVRALGYYDASDLPFYYWLANEYAIADHYHCSLLGPTWPNRQYLYAASSRGATTNGLVSFVDQNRGCTSDADCGGEAGACMFGGHACVPTSDIGCGCRGTCTRDADCGIDAPEGTCDADGVCAPVGRTIFDYLEQRHIEWKIYASGTPGYALTIEAFLKYGDAHQFEIEDYFADAAAGTLPQVAFIDSHIGDENYAQDDEHPPATPFPGQLFVARVVDALHKSPEWSSSALFLTYDEHGGLYDHVPPPSACPPGDVPAQIEPGDPAGEFDRYGIRVPMMVVSPFAKKHFVAHQVYDHTSILRFVQARFVLPAISGRDANAQAPWEMFDFAAPPHATAPAVTLPDGRQDVIDACRAIWED